MGLVLAIGACVLALGREQAELAAVRSGAHVGHVEFERRHECVETLAAAREAQRARVGCWQDERPPQDWADESSMLKRAPDSIRGIALPLHSQDPEYDYSRELEEIAALGAGWVSLQIVTLQERVDSVEVPLTSERTPPPERVLHTIREARARGLEVLLLPIVLIRDPEPDDWRGTLAPTSRDLWWESYSRYLLHIVDLAARGGATAVSVGSELASLEQDEARWSWLIANARMRFTGLLTYSANWDHFDRIRFWRSLDFAGMTAYFELVDEEEPSLENLAAGWRHARAEMRRLARHAHRPVLFTEVGLPSLRGAAAAPWDYTATGDADLALQQRAFLAFRSVFVEEAAADEPFLGMLLYDWWGLGGVGDTSYTARGKPAEDVWRSLLTGS